VSLSSCQAVDRHLCPEQASCHNWLDSGHVGGICKCRKDILLESKILRADLQFTHALVASIELAANLVMALSIAFAREAEYFHCCKRDVHPNTLISVQSILVVTKPGKSLSTKVKVGPQAFVDSK